jgi:alkylated DNA nucleotide flippase Atl1
MARAAKQVAGAIRRRDGATDSTGLVGPTGSGLTDPTGRAACAPIPARSIPARPAAGADAPGRARATVAAAGPVTTGRRDQLTDFADRVLDVVDAIPPGQVMSYGDIAEYLGQGGPRQVGRVMSLWGGGVAWWRVIHADGSFLPGHEREALARYREEGTPLRGTGPGGGLRVDMRKARREVPVAPGGDVSGNDLSRVSAAPGGGEGDHDEDP